MIRYNTVILQSSITISCKYLLKIKDKISESGNIFVIISSEYDQNGDIANDFLNVIQYGCSIGYQYVNTIIFPKKENQKTSFTDNAGYIIWFVIDKKKQFFNKDAIRESHIWQNVEWGKREKNYNPKGKDPGNVWIPTIDDGKGHITHHTLMSIGEIFHRIADSTLKQSDKGLLLSTSNDVASEFHDTRFDVEIVASDYISTRSDIKPHKPQCNSNNGFKSKILFSSSESMSEIDDNSINVIITSPPYWNLKDYYKKGQIGQEPYSEYLLRMGKVWRECYKKLTQNGSLWININIRVSNNKTILIPQDFVEQCKNLGLHYKGVFIWHKSSGIPTHDKNLVDRHEYVLVFSKSKELTINNSILESYADYKNDLINGGSLWNINRKAGSVGKKYIHPAIYPNELVSRIVAVTTCENQLVLDPFLGSGTTLIASENIGRRCIGFEFNEGFEDLIISRVKNEITNKTTIDNISIVK